MADEQGRDGNKTAKDETKNKEQPGKEGIAGRGEGGVTAEAKKRSKTALDTEGLGVEEISQEAASADKAAGKQGEDPQERKMDKRDYLITIFSLLLALIVVSSGVFIWARYFASDDGERVALSTSPEPVYELKPFFIPLNSNDASKKFVRLTLVLELDNEGLHKKITQQIEEVRSSIFKILVGVSPKKLQWKREVLAEEIIFAINLLLKEEKVKKVLFKDVVII